MESTKGMTLSNIIISLSLVCCLICVSPLSATEGRKEEPSGALDGTVLDKATQRPLPGVNVYLVNTRRGTMTDTSGYFVIDRIPVGSYNLRFSMVGYKPRARTEVLVKPDRTITIDAELEMTPIDLEAVVVHADYFAKDSDVSTSAQSFNSEEVRRAPGGAEDLNRVMMSMPGVVSTTDQINELVVRGGSPIENMTLWDHVEIANTNHFGGLGETGGPIGMINIHFIREAQFYTGGFPAKYGDKLSSVLDVRLREGSREKFTGNVDLNMAGAGGMIEGPLGRKASGMLSYHRGFVDLIKGAIGLTAVPYFQNLQGKMTYDLSPNHKLSLVGLGGIDHIEIKGEEEEEEGEPYYVHNKTDQYIVGLNWKALWGEKAYSLVTLSYANHDFYVLVKDSLEAEETVHKENSWEKTTNVKGEFNYTFDARRSFVVGGSWKHIAFRHRNWSKPWEYFNADSNKVMVFPGLDQNDRDDAMKWAGFAHFTWRPFKKLSLKEGIRYDYVDYTEEGSLSNRFGIGYDWTRKTALNLSTGSFYQTPPYHQLTVDPENRQLKNIFARHYVVGIEHLFQEDLKFTTEVYRKNYRNWPVSRDDSTRVLVSKGEKFSQGIDVFLQKKLTGNTYGLLSYSLSRAKVREPDQPEYHSTYDNRHVFTLSLGYRRSERWEISTKWRYMSGRPYTPFLRREPLPDGNWDAVYDDDHPNSARYPDYHRLDVRYSSRKSFKTWNLVAYFEVENVYARKNVWGYMWDRKQGELDTVHQFGLFPVGGFAIEF